MDSIEVSQDNVTTTQQTIQIITIFPLNMGNYSLSVLFGSFFSISSSRIRFNETGRELDQTHKNHSWFISIFKIERKKEYM